MDMKTVASFCYIGHRCPIIFSMGPHVNQKYRVGPEQEAELH